MNKIISVTASMALRIGLTAAFVGIVNLIFCIFNIEQIKITSNMLFVWVAVSALFIAYNIKTENKYY